MINCSVLCVEHLSHNLFSTKKTHQNHLEQPNLKNLNMKIAWAKFFMTVVAVVSMAVVANADAAGAEAKKPMTEVANKAAADEKPEVRTIRFFM